MDFVRTHDWYYSDSDIAFLTDAQLASSCMNRIISGTFRNPLISSESEGEEHDIEAMICAQRKQPGLKKNKIQLKDFIPGLRPLPLFPKLSAMTIDQHFSGVKVLASQDPTANSYLFPPPSRRDHHVFEEIQETYIKEQQEFLDWAKKEWVTSQCIRALRPRPILERVYEDDWTVRAAALASLPTTYEYYNQITMSPDNDEYELTHIEDLKTVELSELPVVTLPALHQIQMVTSMPDECLPRVCPRHPCRTVLPDEDKLCALSMRDIHGELANYAAANDAEFIVDEDALKCMLQPETEWTLPITSERVPSIDGGAARTVVVIGAEVTPRRQLTRQRTARALQLMLRHRITKESQERTGERRQVTPVRTSEELTEPGEPIDGAPHSPMDVNHDSSDEEDDLVMDLGEEENKEEKTVPNQTKETATKDTGKVKDQNTSDKLAQPNSSTEPPVAPTNILDMFNKCTCQGTPFQKPPHVSYTKWKLGTKSGKQIPIIIHCSHKHVRDIETEVILNAIPEFQVDLGGAAQSVGKIKSFALSLLLRRDAVLLSTRVEVQNGHIVSYEWSELAQLENAYAGQMASESAATLYTVLSQLQLPPGHYTLQHEPSLHGENAILYAALPEGTTSSNPNIISLAISSPVNTEKETKHLQVPPALGAALLPVHKLRRTLPLAFSPYPPPPHFRKKPTKEELKIEAIAATKKQKRQTRKSQRKLKQKQQNMNNGQQKR